MWAIDEISATTLHPPPPLCCAQLTQPTASVGAMMRRDPTKCWSRPSAARLSTAVGGRTRRATAPSSSPARSACPATVVPVASQSSSASRLAQRVRVRTPWPRSLWRGGSCRRVLYVEAATAHAANRDPWVPFSTEWKCVVCQHCRGFGARSMFLQKYASARHQRE